MMTSALAFLLALLMQQAGDQPAPPLLGVPAGLLQEEEEEESAPAEKQKAQPAAPEPSPVGAPAAQPPAEQLAGATPPAATADGSAAGVGEEAVEIDLVALLEQPEEHLPAIVALETDVAALYQTLDGLVSEGEESAAHILKAAEGMDGRLEVIGVNEGRARQIDVMSDEVRALRARLRLLELRAPSINNPNDGFKSITELSPDTGKELGSELLESMTQDDEAASASVADAVPPPPTPYPSREALLAFKQGDMDGVLRIMAGHAPSEMQPDALYAYGCAQIEIRDFAAARETFQYLQEVEDRRTLSDAATRQLKRMDCIEKGVVVYTSVLEEVRGR